MNHNAHVITYILETFRKKCESMKLTKDGWFNKGQIQGPWLTACNMLRKETGDESFAPKFEWSLSKIESAMLASRKGHYHTYQLSLEQCLNFRR